MNIKEVMASSHRILDELNNQTDEVLARAELDAQRSFHGMSGFLSVQAPLAENEEDLLRIADFLHELASNVPGMLHNGYQPGQWSLETLEPVLDEKRVPAFIKEHKERLSQSLASAYDKLDDLVPYPDPPENVAQFTDNPDPWKWFGAFKDDPTWDQLLEDIERERDMHLV